jgi:hypothetical protein
MIYTSIILFFLMAVVSIYALIQTRKNYILLFILIPFILVSTIFAGYSIFALQGTPKRSVPSGEIEIVFVEVAKPDIVFLARIDGEGLPLYFRIPYTDENKKLMGKLQRDLEIGQKIEGSLKMKPRKGSDSQNEDYQWDRIKRDSLPPKSSALKAQGVDDGLVRMIEQQSQNSNTSQNSDNANVDPYDYSDGAF